MRKLFIISLVLLLTGCDPYRFKMQRHNALKGRKPSPIESVGVEPQYFKIKENGWILIL